MTTSTPGPIDRQLIAGVAALRAATWVGVAVVVVLSRDQLDHPAPALVAVAAAGAVTVGQGLAARSSRRRPGSVVAGLAAELVVALALLGLDGYVYADGRSASLAGAWPLAVLIELAVRYGRSWGWLAAAAFGSARAISEGVASAQTRWTTGRGLAVASSTVLYAVAVGAVTFVADRVRSAEDAEALARAREQVGRDLHDGMLQTLAVVQRRSTDADLVRLARTQEAELRAYLADLADLADLVTPSVPGERGCADGDLEAGLRREIARAVDRFGLRVEAAVVTPLGPVAPAVEAALVGAVGELLANVAKHAGTDRAVVFAATTGAPAGAPADGSAVEVSVRDDGVGFDVDTVARRGLAGSVAARLAAVGGSVAVESTEGTGSLVTLRAPAEGRRGEGAGR